MEYWGDGVDNDGNIIYDTACCPICQNEYEVGFDEMANYCSNCGQKLDWGGSDD